jgi:hypothetical protein
MLLTYILSYTHIKIQIITHTLLHVLNYNKPPLKHASDGSHALQLVLEQQGRREESGRVLEQRVYKPRKHLKRPSRRPGKRNSRANLDYKQRAHAAQS